jgi:hypothetical protein
MRNRACAYGRSLSPRWGIWNVAQTRAGVLPTDLEGREFITAGVLDRRGIVAWSLWEGYLKMPSGAALQELLAEHQISLTNVRALVFDLRRLVEALGPHSDPSESRRSTLMLGTAFAGSFQESSVTLKATGGRSGPNDRATRPRAVQLG